MRLSYSKIKTFDDCPAAYKFKHVDFLDEPAGEAALRGQVVHAALAAYDRHLLASGFKTDVTIVPELTDKALEEHQAPDSIIEEVHKIMETVANGHLFDPELTAAVEEKWVITIKPGLEFSAIIDRLEIEGTKARVIDYKTDWQIRSAKDDFQLHCYAMAVAKEYPHLTDIEMALDFVRYGVLSEDQVSADEVFKTEKRIINAADRIATAERNKHFIPTPGERCAYCGFTLQCPMKDKLQEAGAITSQDEAVKMAAELNYLEAAAKARKEILKKYTNINGPVAAGGVAWGHWASKSRKITDAKTFIEILGPEAWAAVNVDSRKMAKYFKNQETAEALQPIIQETGSSSFRSKKEDDTDDD
jgi:CRISPR/Cas system-associated exonuclease Cas4 (RecB family)